MSRQHAFLRLLARRLLVVALAIASVVVADMSLSVSASARATTDALGQLNTASATNSVLCDRTALGVTQRQYFAPACPSGWRSADGRPVLCSRASDKTRRTYSKRCPTGWQTVTVDPGLQCLIVRRSYSCSFPAGTTAPSTPVASTTSIRVTTTTVASTTSVRVTTTTVAPTTTTTVAPTTTTTVAPTTTTTVAPTTFDARGWEAEILRLTNVERQNAGLGSLAACGRLATAALAHSNRMLEGQFFAHNDPGTGTSVSDRVRASGYTDGANGWGAGENIAMGYESAAATMVGWMNSPGHRANILQPAFTHLGVGVSIGVWEAWRGKFSNWNKATMATQNFGSGGTC